MHTTTTTSLKEFKVAFDPKVEKEFKTYKM